MQATLVLTDGDPYLEIKEFIFPSTSKHQVQSTMMNDTPDEPIRHQSMLDPGPTNLIKALGQRQAKISLVLSVLDNTYCHLKVNKPLIHTMLRKGRDKKYGDNNDNSMVVFLEYGIGMKGQGGTFNVTMCDLKSQLEQWSVQTKLETQIAATCVKDLYFMDTIHNITKFTLQSGPIVSPDYF